MPTSDSTQPADPLRVQVRQWVRDYESRIAERDRVTECADCKRRFPRHYLEIKHIIPINQGRYRRSRNLQLLCVSCVSKKRVKDRLFVECGGICASCKCRFDSSCLQIDHIIPVNQGGTDDPENLQLLCEFCAFMKWVRDRLFVECGGICASCKRRFDSSCLQIDHIIPVNQGGTNDLKNLQLLCESCISEKEATPNERQPIPKWVKAHLFQECGGECAGCMDTFRQIGNLQIDHIIPVHLGGTNELENLQLLCSSCNSRKGTGTMPELINRLRREGIRT